MRLKYVKAILGFLFAVLMVVLWWLLVRKLSPKDVSDAATALALLVGGGWTFYQFALRKSFESALQIESAVATEPMGANFVVSIDVVLSNIGNRRIGVPRRLPAEDIVHYENSVKYPVDLQVRALATDLPCPAFAGWWPEGHSLKTITGIPRHISLLYEYSEPNEKDAAITEYDFFMEPGEKYHLGTVFVLPAGHYVAKVVFVGERSTAAEYWSRTAYFRVPTVLRNAVTSSENTRSNLASA